MGQWITGDIHVHSHHCGDGTLSIGEIIERSREYCDFIAISGHSRQPEFDRTVRQYAEVLEARKKYSMPIFHTGEIEFPVPRHVIMLTEPDNREHELQEELVRRYCRRAGAEGIETALEELAFIRNNWGERVVMIFNHPNAPDVPTEDLHRLASSPIFKILACVDRGERRAPQTWDIGGAWDELLSAGHRIYTHCGSDFHRHFADGGTDYMPGEFAQDHLWVENNTYRDIIDAYRNGRFYCTLDNIISDPVFRLEKNGNISHLHLEFVPHGELDAVEIISDGRVIEEFDRFSDTFAEKFPVPEGSYYRVRGRGKPRRRKYSDGEFEPLFLLNPIFSGDY